MDRPVDQGSIELALAGATRLPTPAELAELLADAEIGLLSRRPAFDPALAKTAWYLHAIASVRRSLDIYGPARQRACFQVASQAFDLLIADPDLDSLRRLRFAFAAQVGFLRSEANPNAMAVRRRLAPAAVPPDLLLGGPSHPLELGIATLALDTAWLFSHLATLRAGRIAFERESEVDIREGPFAARSYLADGIWALLSFLVYGRLEAATAARSAFLSGVQAADSQDDVDARWVASHLLAITDDLDRGSVWTALPPDVPGGVRRAFSFAAPRIVNLWPPQLRLLSDPAANPLSADAKRVFIGLPTSGGKTLVSQLLVVTHLARDAGGVCYVAPTRSLCREVRSSLHQRLRNIEADLVVQMSDDLFDEGVAASRIQVMTPERLAYQIRSDPSSVLDRFGLFVFDEAHSLGDSQRGWVLESVLSYLHWATAESDHRVVLMSAAIGNQVEIARWLDPNDGGISFESEWRGPRRANAIYTNQPEWEAPLVERPDGGADYRLRGILHVRPPGAGGTRSLALSRDVGILALRGNQTRLGRSTPFYATIAPLAHAMVRSGPVLIISPTRGDARRLALRLAETKPEWVPVPARLLELAEARLGADHPLCVALRGGAAYHHASLPTDIQAAIEDATRAEDLKLLVATTTLTEGINLPVRTVIIAAQGAYGEGGRFDEFITGSRLINAIGRAGRAVKETEGWVVLARPQYQPEDFDRLQPDPASLMVRSNLVADTALAELEQFDEARRAGVDAVFAQAHEELEDFLSWLWFVIHSTGDGAPEEIALAATTSTLAFRQAPANAQQQFRSASRELARRYVQANDEEKVRLARAGTSLRSARTLSEIAHEIAALAPAWPDVDAAESALAFLVAHGWIDRLLSLREHSPVTFRNHRGGANIRYFTVPHGDLLSGWIAGNEMAVLGERFLADVTDSTFRLEQVADYVTATFENYLPWVLGTTITWANEELSAAGEASRVCPDLPAFTRYGANSNEAVTLLRAGVLSRVTANVVAAEYQNRATEDDGLRAWLRSMSVAEWRQLFSASPADLRSLLQYCRLPGSRIVPSLLEGEQASVNLGDMASVADGTWEVRIDPIPGDPEPARLGLWIGGELADILAPAITDDVEAALALGVPLEVRLVVDNGAGRLDLQIESLTE